MKAWEFFFYGVLVLFASAIIFSTVSCKAMIVEKPFKLEQEKCVKDDMFPPEARVQPDFLIRMNQGLPPKTWKGVWDAHVACHNAERDAIEENQKRVVLNGDRVENPVWRSVKDTSAYILWGAVLVGMAIAQSNVGVLLWFLL